jgi:predicted enzyme related to lactoylglutathione lyase
MTKRNIVHIEIPTSDGEKSGKFYQQLFGWKLTHDDKMDYTMWEPSTGPGGGFSPLGENTKVGDVLIYVDSDDIKADLKKVKKLGGKAVRQKSEIPGIGWWGVFTDPTGNMIALFTSMNPVQEH